MHAAVAAKAHECPIWDVRIGVGCEHRLDAVKGPLVMCKPVVCPVSSIDGFTACMFEQLLSLLVELLGIPEFFWVPFLEPMVVAVHAGTMLVAGHCGPVMQAATQIGGVRGRCDRPDELFSSHGISDVLNLFRDRSGRLACT